MREWKNSDQRKRANQQENQPHIVPFSAMKPRSQLGMQFLSLLQFICNCQGCEPCQTFSVVDDEASRHTIFLLQAFTQAMLSYPLT